MGLHTTVFNKLHAMNHMQPSQSMTKPKNTSLTRSKQTYKILSSPQHRNCQQSRDLFPPSLRSLLQHRQGWGRYLGTSSNIRISFRVVDYWRWFPIGVLYSCERAAGLGKPTHSFSCVQKGTILPQVSVAKRRAARQFYVEVGDSNHV